MFTLRPVLFVNGCLLLILACAMTVPVAVDLLMQGQDALAFQGSALISAFSGLLLMAASHAGRGQRPVSTRQAFVLITLAWSLAPLAAALPFHLSSLHLGWIDSLFEATSGLTTTGATVLRGLDHAPPAVLLWRAMLNWLGGGAILMTAILLLPVLKVGGMQLFRVESSDSAAHNKARQTELIIGILLLYTLFTILLATSLLVIGEMPPFDAACHAMSTLSTGGFSTSDDSLGHFSQAARWLCVIGMLLGASTFSLYLAPFRRHNREASLWQDSQLQWYGMVIGTFIGLMSFWNWAVRDLGAAEAISDSAFNVVSVLTTTGFHSGDYNSWGGFAHVVFFIMSFVGGCTGSTAGGIKVFRYEVLFSVCGIHIRRILHPHGMFTIDFNRQRVSQAVIRSVLGFMMLYYFCFAGLALVLTMCGLDEMTALSGAAAALGNLGPGLGSVIGPAGSYAPLPDLAKFLLAGGMVLGRLELAAALLLLSRSFWRE